MIDLVIYQPNVVNRTVIQQNAKLLFSYNYLNFNKL